MRTDWRTEAACRTEDPELFFPLGEDSASWAVLDERSRAAVAVCLTCPVQRECLAWALDTGQDAGVWGGLNSRERRALRRAHSTT